MRNSLLFFIWVAVFFPAVGVAQLTTTVSPIKRFDGLEECDGSNSNLTADLLKVQDAFQKSPFAGHFPQQRTKYQMLSFAQKHMVLDKTYQYRSSFGRREMPFIEQDEKKMAFNIAQARLMKLGGVLSVGAGGDVRGGSFGSNRRIFVSQNSQGKACWTENDQIANAEQVFDYDGFEEVAAMNPSPDTGATCSAVIVGQSHALTARHCDPAGVLYIPTRAARQRGSASARNSTKCSLANQYTKDCEFEVVKYEDVSALPQTSSADVKLDFKSALDNKTASVYVSAVTGSPDLRLIKFRRMDSSKQIQPLLMTSRIGKYSQEINKGVGVFSFVRAGYGMSHEKSPLALTIGSWRSARAPSHVTGYPDLDSQSLYAYVALFHQADQKSRICKGDSGGALFFGVPNGKENKDDSGPRLVVGIVSAAKEHQSADRCLQSPIEVSHVINSRYFKLICDASNNEINGCKK
jgi:Trypsin